MIAQTGQKDCYNETGEKISCSLTGQDGEFRMGQGIPSPRFEEKGHTVTDRLTGLEWTRDAGFCEFPLTWREAFEFIRRMNSDQELGHNDWRLPNRRELFSLVSHTNINPAIDVGHPFENVFSGYYWTSNSCARLPGQAWYIHLGGARVYRGIKNNSYMLWPVRAGSKNAPGLFQTGQKECYDSSGKIISCGNSGQDGDLLLGTSWPSRRFIAEKGMVIDRLTGLMWTKDADLAGKPVGWTEALNTVRNMNGKKLSGHEDWRLPNIRELESLVDLGTHNPALYKDHRFENVRAFYWSSTTSIYDTPYAWVLYLNDGYVGVGFKPKPEFHVWAVRGATV